ncbi:MAG TPA: hypothetical protein VIV83_07480 [Gemmatimonadales bacterium]|jgi:hypothetical protein
MGMDSVLAVSAPSSINETLLVVFTGVLAVATILALFQDWVRSLIWHPTLKATIESRPPDCHKTSAYYGVAPNYSEAPCFYYRLRVTNTGWAAAHIVEVYATNVERRTSTGEWQRVERFIPQYLNWSLLETIQLPIIPPGASRHCDVGHVVNPKHRRNLDPIENDEQVPEDQTLLSLDVRPRPLRRSHLLPKGEYRITLEIAASNAKPRTAVLFANNPGTWHDDEAIMLRDGVSIALGSALTRSE